MIKGVGHSVVRLTDFGYSKPRSRKMTNLHPIGGGEEWGVHNNSCSNIERALIERVFTVKGEEGLQVVPPQPKPGAVKRLLGKFRKQLLHYAGRVQPLSTDQFVLTYVGKKRALYQRAAESLDLLPLRKQDAYIGAFIKDEKTNLTRKDDPCPRIIQPRSPRFNVEIGKHLKPMEKTIFNAIAMVFGSTTVMKGLNADQRGTELAQKWAKFNKPVALLLDATRFDQHCNRQIIDWEHDIEEKITLDREDLKRLNAMRRVNTCFARAHDGGFKYTLNGGRMSGDMDTAMANCLTMCAMTWSFMKEGDYGKFEYMNDGDDGVLIFEEEVLERVLVDYQDYFLGCGFQMKLDGVAHTMEDIEFCQARPIFDGHRWRFVRDPRICIGKDCLTITSLTDCDTLDQKRNAIGWCGMSLAGDMPIFCALYRTFISRNQPPLEYTTGMQFLARGMTPTEAPVTIESRLSFWAAYDISPDDQIAVEAFILSTQSALTADAVLVKSYSHKLTTILDFP